MSGESRAFPANYDGHCAGCPERIHVGQLIESTADGYAHADCAAELAAADAAELRADAEADGPCPTCFMIGRCPCEDGL